MTVKDFGEEIRSHLVETIDVSIRDTGEDFYEVCRLSKLENKHRIPKATWRAWCRAWSDIWDLQEDIDKFLRDTGQNSPRGL